MEKKSILFLLQFFYPEYNSSATLPYDTAKFFVEKGYSVSALCGYPKEYINVDHVPMTETIDGIHIQRLCYAQKDRRDKIGRLKNYFSFTYAVFKHRKELKNYSCVMVYSNPPILPIIPIYAKRKYGTPFVFVAYDVYPEVAYPSRSITKGNLIDCLMKKVNDRLYTYADHVIALTDEMKEFLLLKRPQLSKNRISVISNWAHEGIAPYRDNRYSRFGYKDGQFIVSYFGNMGICQEMDTLINAIHLLKDDSRIAFLIAGHGSKRTYVEEKVGGLPNVKILDYLVDDAFEDALRISSCSVVSLESGLMGTCAPSKYYSYIQNGIPVLAVVDDESYLRKEAEEYRIGFGIKIGDSKAMANAIVELLEDKDLYTEMEQRAKVLYQKNYAKDIGLNKYLTVISKTLD